MFLFRSEAGSSLVATLLACDPFALVYSESLPIYSVLFGCERCSEEKHIKLLRDIVTIMGQSPYHRRIMFNLQPVLTRKMDIILKAFPITPWAFLFQQPEQLLMSQLHSEGPSLRSNEAYRSNSRSTNGPNEGTSEGPNVSSWGESDDRDASCLVYWLQEVKDITR